MNGSAQDDSSKDAAGPMKGVITDVSEVTAVQEKENDAPIQRGKKIVGPGFGNIFKDGPIILRKSGEFEKLVPGGKGIGTSLQDAPLPEVFKIFVVGAADNVNTVARDTPGQRVENKLAKIHINDKPLVKGNNSMEDNVSEHVESGQNEFPKTGTSTKSMPDDTLTENMGQRRSRDDSSLDECEVELGCDFIEECLDQGQGKLSDDPCLNRENEVEYGSDFIENV